MTAENLTRERPEYAGAGLPSTARWRLAAAAIVCGAVGACSIAIYLLYFSRHPWQDWMVYYEAARAFFAGDLPLIFDGPRFTARLNADFAGWLTEPFRFRSFVYPPTFLLLLLPLGLLGFAGSAALFEAGTLAGLLGALRCGGIATRRQALHLLSLALAPPVWFNLATGQNGFLSAALLVAGFGLLPARPLLAGVFLGLLTYKPQLWLLVPVALLAAREWRVLAVAVATGAALALVSAAILGVDAWMMWLHWVIAPPPADYRAFLECCRMHDESVFTNLVLLGTSEFIANLGQFAAIVLGAACVWWCYRRPMAGELRLAVLLAATMLAAPHAANYDAVLLVVAATMVFAYGLDYGFRYGGAVVPVLAWVIQLFNPPDAFRLGLLTPLITVLLILCAMASGRRKAEPVSA